jgi:hypothetical protein
VVSVRIGRGWGFGIRDSGFDRAPDAVGKTIAFTAQSFRFFLFEVSPADPFTLDAASTGLLAAALAAACVPVRRGSWIDPTDALRSE